MIHICFDVDDTLNSLMEKWLIYHNSIKGTIFKYEELVKNPPHEILDESENEYRGSLHSFRQGWYNSLKPNQLVLDWFKKNGHKAHFSVLTSAFKNCIPITSNWLFTYFGEWIRTFAFIPSKVDENDIHNIYDRTKAEWLVRNKVDYFIDDSIKNCNEAIEKGITTFLVKQPWSWNLGMEISEILEILGRVLK